ncbi:hypothetical protein METP2_00561 [Methanosarcinales archaeon]|nr:DUF1616 domain-containing protein [Candidatus Methanoperedens sp.]CAG0957113.1 hypothetical protein METP2_00561 [Methanosarcinales archaeon]
MKKIRIIEYLKNRLINNLDLIFIPILVILAIIFILIPPFNQGFLRIIFALPLLLFLPGYMLIAIIFPKRGELSSIERFTFSIGFSIAITVFDGFGLNYTRWGFKSDSITISLSLIIGMFFLLTLIQRWRYGKESYGFTLSDIRSFYYILKNKEPETGPDHALEKMLIKTMIISILIVSAMVIYTKVNTEPEKFTSLYILGADGKAENYLTEVSIGEPYTILVGVENYEYAPVYYMLRVNFGGKILKEYPIILDHNNRWLNNVTVIPELASSIASGNKTKLEIDLFKDNKSYRSVHLMVNTNLDSVKFSELPNIINGDMESDEGWLFFGSSPDIKGSYIYETISSRVYEMNYSSRNPDSSGIIYQNLTTRGDVLATLSFDVIDSEYSNTSSFALKQALLDGQVIWETRVGDNNNTWAHIGVPVLLSGKNTLAFRVYSNSTDDLTRTVLWDNIKLKLFKSGLPQLGDTLEKKGLAVKLYNFSRTENLSSLNFIIENTGKIEKNVSLKPAPVIIDDLDNQYEMLGIGLIDRVKLSPVYPGVLKKGTISFRPINNSAKDLRIILYLNGEKYEFNYHVEPKILGEDGNTPDNINATMGDIITKNGFEVMLNGFQNTPEVTSQVSISVKNIESEEKPFKLNPSAILIDDLGNQYGMVIIQRSGQIKQTTVYPGAIRRGIIFFKPINPDAKDLKLILYLNGNKYEFKFKAQAKILEEKGFSNSISEEINAGLGDTITQDGFALMLKGFQNTPGWYSRIDIAVKNMENERKQFYPSPIIIDDLGNQYEGIGIQRSTQIKLSPIYPGVARRGSIFFEEINPDAKYLKVILYLNGKIYKFGLKAESKILDDKDLNGNISAYLPINATMGEALTQGGLEIKLKSFQNTPGWNSQVVIAVKNFETEDKQFKYNSSPVLIDDLGNQYEMTNIKRSNQIEQTTIAPSARIEGAIFFEPIKEEAKYILFILPISSDKYIFGFEPKNILI